MSVVHQLLAATCTEEAKKQFAEQYEESQLIAETEQKMCAAGPPMFDGSIDHLSDTKFYSHVSGSWVVIVDELGKTSIVRPNLPPAVFCQEGEELKP